MILAANTHGIDLIVGGHSHSYLGDSSNPLSEGPYPTIVTNLKGEKTLIVQVRGSFEEQKEMTVDEGRRGGGNTRYKKERSIR